VAEGSEEALRRMLRELPEPSIRRFEALRSRCVELREIALGIKHPSKLDSPASLEESRLAGLDKLLWINLRLLFTEHSLSRFLSTTNEKEIRAEIGRLEARLESLGSEKADAEDPRTERMRRTLEDNLATCRDRLANYEKAKDNYELVKLEIDRIENKIRSLSELAVNRQEPDFISSQVDEVASSLLNTERTLSELRFATGLELQDETAPALLRKEVLRSRR
jgi:hypothetical protein